MKYRFKKYASIYDENFFFYGLAEGGVEKTIDGEKFIEVTTDFKRSQMVKSESVKVVGYVIREF